jgi:phospholipase C
MSLWTRYRNFKPLGLTSRVPDLGINPYATKIIVNSAANT